MARFILAMLLSAAALSASAFESWEHKRLSDLAYHLAVEIHCPDDASDAMCDELRPETMVNVSKDGALARWCNANSKENVCVKLSNLYVAFPQAEYDKSKLARSCDTKVPAKPACANADALRSASRSGNVVFYADQKALLLWCNAKQNRSDEFCNAFGARVKAQFADMRDIIRACYRINDQSKCQYDKPDDRERLAWASFFNPLSRENQNGASPRRGEPAPPEEHYKDDSNLSYGDVTKCVDYFLTPDKLMAGSETRLWYPTEDKQIASRHRLRGRQLYPSQREDLDLSFKYRCRESYTNLEGARSGHVNHTHFQAELLISQRSQHLLALSLHAVERNRMAGLTANAISDHYLQDSFAPGHITTWRSRLTDLAANAFHDRRNREGLFVKVDKKRFNKMMHGDQHKALYERVIHLVEKNTSTSEAKVVREYFLYPDADHADCKRFRCNEARNDDEEVLHIKKILRGLLLKLRDDDQKTEDTSPHCADGQGCVFMRGDNDLWMKTQEEQRLLLLLVQIRSILDVFESPPPTDEGSRQYTMTDSFSPNSSWIWRATEEEKKVLGTRLYPPASDLKATIGPVDYNVSQAFEESSKYDHSYQSYDPVYGISLGVDNMAFGEQQTRWHLGFEKLIFGEASEKRRSMNVAGVVGIQKLFEPTSNGYGITGRISLVAPQTESIFSLIFKEIRIGSSHYTKHWRPVYGLRFDQGFTSFATMYFQVSRDYAAQKDGRIESGISVGAGVQIAAPRCRIPLVKNMCE